jgi:glycosyltransferase involved in cell wall biosynthesis
MTAPRLSIVIPAYNEEEGIAATLRELLARFADAEVIVVDDGSTDRTADEVRAIEGVRLLTHEMNRGYGAAIRTGIRNAGGNFIAWYDSDGQHTPESLEAMWQLMQTENIHAVIGARTAASAIESRRRLGKWLLSLIVQLVAGRRMPDVNCGLRIFRREVIRRYTHLLPDRFSASITSTLLMIKRGYRVRFVPVVTRPRVGRSTVRIAHDGLSAIHTSLRILVLFQAFQAFTIVSAVLFLVGAIYGVTMALTFGRGFPTLASVLVLSGVIIFFIGLLTDQVVALRMERLEENAENDEKL